MSMHPSLKSKKFPKRSRKVKNHSGQDQPSELRLSEKEAEREPIEEISRFRMTGLWEYDR